MSVEVLTRSGERRVSDPAFAKSVSGSRRAGALAALHFKWHRTVTGRKAAGDGREPFDERQPAHERDVFAKDDQLLFVINRRATAVRVEQERGVENVVVIVGLGARNARRQSSALKISQTWWVRTRLVMAV